MQSQAGRIAGFGALLAALWIGVYWWWPSDRTKVTFASETAPVNHTTPTPPAGAKPAPGPHRAAEMAENRPSSPEPRPKPREVLPPIMVEPPRFTEHTVKSGETLSAISKRYFGSSTRANDILRANPLLDPARLRPGRVIRIPKDPGNIQGKPVSPPSEPAQPSPDPVPSIKEYVVHAGDTLSGIATDIYGTSGMARAIYQANRDILADEHSLRVGMRLKLPPKDR